MVWLLLSIRLLLSGGLVRAEPPAVLAAPGEPLEGAEVLEAEAHAEYLRYHLRLEDGRTLQVEVSTRPGGACGHQGLYLHPRWELLGESLEIEDQPAFVAQLCARLGERGAFLVFAEPRATAPQNQRLPSTLSGSGVYPHVAYPGPRPRWLHGVLGALVLVLVPMVWGARLSRAEGLGLLGITLLGVGMRLGLSPRGMQIWDGYNRLTMALGTGDAHAMYGDGYAVVVGLGVWLTGGDLSAVFWTNLFLSMLAPPLAWWVGRQVGGGTVGAVVGLLCAVLPAHLRLAGSEVMQVSVFTLSWLSVGCALRFAHSGAGVAALATALSAGLALHTRPDALPLAGVVVVAALPGVRRAPQAALLGGLVLGGLVGIKLAALGSPEPYLAPLNITVTSTPVALLTRLLPSMGGLDTVQAHPLLPLQGRLHPPLWTALALVGLWAHRRRLRVGGFLAVWYALTGLTLITRTWPSHDLLRFHLGSLAPTLVLTALGVEAVLGRWPEARRWRGWVVGGLLLLTLPHLGEVVRPWAVTTAWQFTRTAPEALPPEPLVLLFPDRNSRATQQGEVLAHLLGPGQAAMELHTWLAADPPPDLPTYVLLTEMCAATIGIRSAEPEQTDARPSPCPALQGRCTLTPLRTQPIPMFNGDYVRLPPGEHQATLARVEVGSCQ